MTKNSSGIVSILEAEESSGPRFGSESLIAWAPVLFAVLAFLFWGGRTLWDTSEARYGQAAFEMLHSGNWLFPTLAAQPHLTKPPLTYWLIGAGMKIFGVNAWGARFFLSVAFFATIMAVRELALTLGFERRRAFAAALIFATAAIPFAGGHTLTTDGFLMLWETLGVLAAWKVWRGDSARRSFWRNAFWISFGLAFLTKGPPGWLPLLVIVIFLLVRKDGRAERPRLASPMGIGLFLVVSLGWYGYMMWENPHLVSYFMVGEVYNRIFTNAHHRAKPLWFYLPILGAGVGPWLVLWPRAGKRLKHFWARKDRRLTDWQFFAVLWLVIPLVIFTVAKSKMVLYVLPLFVPISLFLAQVLMDDFLPLARRKPLWRRLGLGLALFWASVLVVYTGGMDFFAPQRSLRPAAEAFARATAGLPEKPQIYWLWSGSQRYSLGFYMQQVIRNVDRPADADPAAGSPLYVAKEEALAVAERTGMMKFPTGKPYVLSRAEGYVLFARRDPGQAPRREPSLTMLEKGSS